MNNYEEQLKEQLKEIDKDNRSLQQENIYLREKCKELQIIVKEVREYIEDKYAVILADDLFLDHDERIERKRLLELLEILDKAGSDKE